jgi:hypothetical protein
VKPCEIADEPAAAEEEPADLSSEARSLYDLLACQGKVPPGLDASAVKAFCARLGPAMARHDERVRRPLEALLAPLRPARVPSAVVYPLAGADLLGALETFPEARNITTVSSEPAGDPRVLLGLHQPARLRAALDALFADAERLLRGEPGVRAQGPQGILPLLILALAADGDEPVGLRYFRVEPAGTLRYLSKGELAAKAPLDPFASCEVSFLRRGVAQGGAPRVVRHLAADLSDRAVAADPGPIAHLASKGDVGVVLRGADALAGDDHARLRGLLMKRGAFLVSDGTGPSAEQFRQAGLQQQSRPRPGGGPPLVTSRRP